MNICWNELFSPGRLGEAVREQPQPRQLLWLLIFCCLYLTGCVGKPYQGADLATAGFLQRAQTQQQGTLKVTAALPDATETRSFTGLDLYDQGIQPVWLQIENSGSHPARAAIWSIDRNYFSPIEVAYMNRKSYGQQGYVDMERWFYNNGLRRITPPGETRSGLVFTKVRHGTKGVNLDIYSNRRASTFTFFLPLPGFTADYTQVDFDTLYEPQEIRQVGDAAGLKSALEAELPCCVTDETGKLNGGPLNIVLVGTRLAMRRSLLRGDWQETTVDELQTRKARSHRYEGRAPDAVFYQDRADGSERLQLNLWLSPYRVGEESVFVGQAFYRLKDSALVAALRESGALQNNALLARYVGESISADIDSAQRFMIQSFWYNQSLLKMGLIAGIPASTVEDPDTTFEGFGYFTTGRRAVVFLSEAPVALHSGQIIYGSHKLVTGETGDE